MKFTLFLFLMVAVASPGVAQPEPDTLWTRTYGGVGTDVGLCVRLASDGNYVVAGYTQPSAPDDMYLMKINDSGNALWTRSIDLGNIEQANSVWATSDGGYALAGSIQYMDGGNTKVLLVKTNGNGDTLWTRAYGENWTQSSSAIQQTSDGGYILAGTTLSAAGDNDVYLVKTNSIGDTAWTRTFTSPNEDYVSSVKSSSDGGYVLSGYTSVPPQTTPAFVMKTDATGGLQWRRDFGGLFNMAVLAEEWSDGGYMVAGTAATNEGTPHLAPYLMKMDSDGNPIWTQLHSASPLDKPIFAAQRTSDGGFVMSGWIGNLDSAVYGAEIVRMDSLGNLLWSRTYALGTAAVAYSVVENAEHGYLAAGVIVTNDNGDDVYVIGTGPEGLVMVYPNGGETVGIGRPLDIRWNGSVHGGNVSLQVNRSYPSANWETIAASASNCGLYAWNVSGAESDHARIRVQHLVMPELSDTSDADLSFRIPGLRLIWPNGGETVLSGVRDTVRFQRLLVPDILALQFNRDYPGGTWEEIVSNISSDSTVFWIVQLPGGTHCRLRMVSQSDSTCSDVSDSDFLLRAPQMTLTAPNGGEQLPVGVPCNVIWSAPEHQGSIRITLNRDYPNGSWEIIAGSSSNDGQYSWTPTAPASDHCRIRVATVFDPQSYTESAADFTITDLSAGRSPNEIPTVFQLNEPYPNPFNSQTMLSYSVPARGEITLTIHDLSGRTVRTIAHGVSDRGLYQIPFNAGGLPSGMYFYRLQWGAQTEVKKMLLLK